MTEKELKIHLTFWQVDSI